MSLQYLYHKWCARTIRPGYCHACCVNKVVCYEETTSPVREYCSERCIDRYYLIQSIPSHLGGSTLSLNGMKRLNDLSESDLDRIALLPLDLQIALLELVFPLRETDSVQFSAMMSLRRVSEHYATLIDTGVIPLMRSLPSDLYYFIGAKEFLLFTGLRSLRIRPNTGYITSDVLTNGRHSLLEELILDFCTIELGEESSWGMKYLARLDVSESYCDQLFYIQFTQLTELNISHTPVNVELLTSLTHLRTLALSTTAYEPLTRRIENVLAISQLTALQKLSLYSVTETGLDRAIGSLNGLTSLVLIHIHSPVRQAFLTLTQLASLKIDSVTGFQCGDLARQKYSLTDLYLSSERETDLRLDRLVDLAALSRLQLGFMDTIIQGEVLASLSHLEELRLPGNSWNIVGGDTLSRLTQLRVLHMSTHGMMARQVLPYLTNLTELSVDSLNTDDTVLQPLQSLQKLSLYYSRTITEDAFTTMNTLTSLDITNSQDITKHRLHLTPYCRVRYTEFSRFYDVTCTAAGELPVEEMLVL
jgi:hypothetical protein